VQSATQKSWPGWWPGFVKSTVKGGAEMGSRLPISPDSMVQLQGLAVQSHLEMLQGVVSRMATNSTSCKAWCVGLVSAIVVVVTESGRSQLLVVAMLPIVVFGMLDVYYLFLERRFRWAYETLLGKILSGAAEIDDLFATSSGSSAPGP
jgi:hypothetical protein